MKEQQKKLDSSKLVKVRLWINQRKIKHQYLQLEENILHTLVTNVLMV